MPQYFNLNSIQKPKKQNVQQKCSLVYTKEQKPKMKDLVIHYINELRSYSNAEIVTKLSERKKYKHKDYICECSKGKENLCKDSKKKYFNIVYDSYLRVELINRNIGILDSIYDNIQPIGSDYYHSDPSFVNSNVSFSNIPPEFTNSSPFSNSFGHTTN